MTESMKEVIGVVLDVEKRLEKGFSARIIETVRASEKRILTVMNNRFVNVYDHLGTIDDRLTGIEGRLTNVEVTVDNIRLELDAGLKAIDSHAIQLFDHQKRVGRLEKRLA